MPFPERGKSWWMPPLDGYPAGSLAAVSQVDQARRNKLAQQLRSYAAAIEEDSVTAGAVHGFAIVLLTDGEPVVGWSAWSVGELLRARRAFDRAVEARRGAPRILHPAQSPALTPIERARRSGHPSTLHDAPRVAGDADVVSFELAQRRRLSGRRRENAMRGLGGGERNPRP